jgi:hypothetical protein
MHKELKIISGDEFGLLLFHIDQLPYTEARLLGQELKDTYRQCLDKWHELECLVGKIRSKKAGEPR